MNKKFITIAILATSISAFAGYFKNNPAGLANVEGTVVKTSDIKR